MADYEIIEKVGEGAYGVVYKARDTKSNQIVALKKVKLDTLLDTVYNEGNIFMVFEYLYQDLRKYMRTTQASEVSFALVKVLPYHIGKRLSNYESKGIVDCFSYVTFQSFLYQVLCGIAYCHSHGVLHQDLKPENLLLSQDGVIKLADFGQASDKRIGCIFAEFVRWRVLFPGNTKIEQLFKVFRILGTPNETVWPGVTDLAHYKPVFPKWEPQELNNVFPTASYDAIDLLKKMLMYKPSSRISARMAMAHPLF